MKKLLPYLSVIAYLLVGQTERAFAQEAEFGTDQLAGLVTASTRDLFDIVTGIINVVLYFLGGIAVLLMMYAGWLWFTSRGNSDQVKKAKGIMVSAVVGLMIIFASYAIANFVVGNLYNAVNPDGEGGESGGGGSPGYVTCTAPDNTGNTMRICSVSPSSNTAGGYVTISGWNFGDYVNDANSNVYLVPEGGTIDTGTEADLVSCGTTPYWRFRYADGANRFYRIKAIVPEVTTGQTYSLAIRNLVAGVTREIVGSRNFTVLAGTAGPSIACFEPEAAPRGSTVRAYGRNFGTSGTRTMSMTGWNGTAATNIDIPYDPANWSDTEITFTIPNEALASDIRVYRDASSDAEYFSVTCVGDTNCASGCCVPRTSECRALNICAGTSVVSGPRIDYISPDNSAVRNLISIRGSGFGDTRGTGNVILTNSITNLETAAVLPSTLNASCQDLWTDTDIIVGIPERDSTNAPLAQGAYTIRVRNDAGESTSGVAFTVNTINRPGICWANPNNGSIDTSVLITGLGFRAAAGNTVTYGGTPGFNVVINADNTATSRVPNLSAGIVGLQINDGTNLSNPYPFTINQAPAGDPNIVNISPENGPGGTYLTINGTNFGDSRGTGRVAFEGTPTLDGSFSFPLQCSSSLWNDTKILVKVPAGLTINNNYNVRVIRSDGKQSNTKEFSFIAGSPKPGLCSIFPSNGPVNSPIDFSGEYFGVDGSVVFYNNRETTVRRFWGDTNIVDVPVPANAQSGPVLVRSGGQDSEPLNFQVSSCTRDVNCPGQRCCISNLGNYCATNCSNVRMCTYGFPFRTIPIPSTELLVIDHWPACDSSCGNSQIGVGFNVLLDDSGAIPGSDPEDTDNYSITNLTTGAVVSIQRAVLTQNPAPPAGEPAAQVVLEYNNGAPLLADNRYRVTVSTNIRSFEGETLNNPYAWEFIVQQGSCEFTGVAFNYTSYTATRPSQQVWYTASPTANVGACGAQKLRCTSCTYNWSSSQINVATIDANSSRTYREDAISTSNTSIPAGSATQISCQIVQGALSATGSTTLTVDYRSYLQSLYMTGHWPDCVGACLNAEVRMRFNSQLLASTVTATNIHLINVATGADWIIPGGVVLESNNPGGPSYIRIDHLPFEAGQRYRVTVDRTLLNIFNNALTGFNQWEFTVGNEVCQVDHAQALPTPVIAEPGSSVSFHVETTSNTSSCGSIPVSCATCTYQWSSSNALAATVPPASTARQVVASVPITAVDGAVSDISCRVVDGGRNVDSDPARLTVHVSPGVTYSTPQVETYAPPIGALQQCRNVAVEIVFTELMNLDSIRNNLKLLDSAGNAVPADYAFASVDGAAIVGSANNQTRVLLSPRDLLAESSTYRVSWGVLGPGGIVSAHNVPLSLVGMPPALVDNWVFTTGTEICKISFVRTSPSSDWFTCGGNNCEDDIYPAPGGQTGNQHSYSATAYSVQGAALSGAGMNYSWRVSPNEESVQLSSYIGQSVIATAQTKNGESKVSVSVSGQISGVDLGSASASIPVTVFICANPWPSVSTFPWRELNLNFSTYYCQKFTETSASLPYISYPPSPSANNSPGVLAEYIFVVNPSNTTSRNNAFGPLAYYTEKSSGKDINIWEKALSFIKVDKARGQEIPLPERMPGLPDNINFTANGNDVTATWTLLRDTYLGRLYIQRKTQSATTWDTIASFNVRPFPTSYTDEDLANGNYVYRINVCNNDVASPACYDEDALTSYTVEVNAAAGNETNFIIFRVMTNTGHLTVQEWYKEKFPGDPLGTMTTVDGYEAMRVGNTLYISAANVAGGNIYTNIYIIAYSVGANSQTKNIFDQFVDNFQLNTNVNFSNNNDDNLCSDVDSEGVLRSCSTDLDCEAPDYCRSRSLKIRRDVTRLTNLLTMKKYLMSYGASHKACSNNAQMNCLRNEDCPSGGSCVNYYPTLNAGTFVQGQTNSKWPSWTQTLASDLRQTLFTDPINKFYICPDNPNADPATCWDEAERKFSCSPMSYIYGYRLLNSGMDFDLYSHFEYDAVPLGIATFANNLNNGPATPIGINNIDNIQSTLNNYCSGSASLPGTNLCGNGLRDAGEECDRGMYLDNICQRPTDDPLVAGLGLSTRWWNEQITGCNPPGTPEQCQWYQPTLSAALCGGYCRDNKLQTTYEKCDIVNGSINTGGIRYNCLDNGSIACNNSCNMICSGTGLPAAACGDGVWTEGYEQCDPTGSPTGLDGWDCPMGGNVICPATGLSACFRRCDNYETPYLGTCGNGDLEGPELCDPGDYTAPLPADSDSTHTYSCSEYCNFTNQPYCGDEIIQYSRGEICDTTLLTIVRPGQSSLTNQYQCRMVNDVALGLTRCTPTTGGYCGDGIIQNGSGGTYNAGEICDPVGHTVAVADSSPSNQYQCRPNCLSTFGGYCGDGIIQSTEQCDVGITPELKRAEVVIVFDVSRSLAPAATALCNALDDVLLGTALPGFEYKITVMALGDNGVLTTTNTADDIATLADQSLTWQLDAHRAVFNALVTSCPTYTAHSNPASYSNPGNQLRYLSFFDDTTNNISDLVSLSGDDDFATTRSCNDNLAISPGGRLESWGYATKKIIESYAWLPGYQRIIVPVSDEYAWCGGDVSAGDLAKNNENFVADDSSEDILVDIVNIATRTSPATHISPVILMANGGNGTATTVAQGLDNQRLGAEIASATGGISSNQYTNWASGMVRVINSAFCDGNGDGTMDCSLP